MTAALFTSCPPSWTPRPKTEKDAREMSYEAETAGEAAGKHAGETSEWDAGGADAGDANLLTELRLGQKVPLETGPLAEFFDALKAASVPGADRLVRVLHYGDSHTAGDVLTTAVRRTLQTRFGDGGRGFVFLGKPWRSYRPIDIETWAKGEWTTQRIFFGKDKALMDGRYGLGGVAVDAPRHGYAIAAVRTSVGSSFSDKASFFEIYYMKQPGGGRFDVRIDGKKEKTIDSSSESIESGYFSTEMKEARHSLEIRAAGGQTLRLFGTVVERKGPGVVYDTLGINGAFFNTPLRWDETLLSEQIQHRNPDLVVLMYGANDVDIRSLTEADYSAQVRRAVTRFTSAAKTASCLMLGPMDRKGPKFAPDTDNGTTLDMIIEVQRRIAEEQDCAFMDLREMMGGNSARFRWLENGMAQRDGVHLTIPGYRVLGELIAERLLEAFDRYVQEDKTGQAAADLHDNAAP